MNSAALSTHTEAIEQALSRFHQEQQGIAPKQLRATILDDMVVVLSSGVYNTSEQELSESKQGKKLIQSARRDQRALTRREAEAAVAGIMGRRVVRSFFDIDTRTGDQVEVYILERQIDA